MGALDHSPFVSPTGATVVRKVERLTKDRAKTLVSVGLQRCRAADPVRRQRLALAAGCSARCIEKALVEDTLPGIDLLLNMLDEDLSVLDELLAARGVRLAPLTADPAADLATMTGLCDAAATLGQALADGRRDHRETLAVAEKLRPLIPGIEALLREADVIRVGS